MVAAALAVGGTALPLLKPSLPVLERKSPAPKVAVSHMVLTEKVPSALKYHF